MDLQNHLFPNVCRGQAYLPLEQCAPSPVWPGPVPGPLTLTFLHLSSFSSQDSSCLLCSAVSQVQSCLLWVTQLRRWFLVSWHFLQVWAHFKRLQTLIRGLQGRRGKGKAKMGYPNGHNQMIAAELEQQWCSTYFCVAPWSPRQRLDTLSCFYSLKRTSMAFHKPTHLRAPLLFPWLVHHSTILNAQP